jgi:polyphosphate kinase
MSEKITKKEETPVEVLKSANNPSADDQSDPIQEQSDLTPVAPLPEVDLTDPTLYINRELSQIEFNRRVLEESFNEAHPLLERTKFIAIFNSNMDEFFMVRVSGLKQMVFLGISETQPDGLTPREQLVAIHRTLTQMFGQMVRAWQDDLMPALNNAGIQVLDYDDLKSRQQKKLSDYFDREIFPVLTPLAFDPGHPFPHISNLSSNLAVVIRDPRKDETHFARVKVPSILPRFIPLKPIDPDELLPPKVQKFVWVEQVIANNLDRLFPGMEVVAAHHFRVTRNTDMEIQEEEADDLLLTMEDNLRQRHFGKVVRLEIDESTPTEIRELLMSNLEIGNYDTYAVDGPIGLSSLFELHKLEYEELKDSGFQPALLPVLRTGESIFQILRRQDVFLHHPYDSFLPVVDFVQAAAADSDVLAIKQTLYRIGPNPPIVHALMRARENGKQVSVLVELKARFDEESNIEWARALEQAGVHVVYGLVGLKTHCKITLVVRRERDGIRRYVHLGTGNYNTATARIYTDFGLITCNPDIGADASELFNYLTGYSNQDTYRQFLVAPVSLRRNLLGFIAQEAALGKSGRIIIKANSLVDAEIIQALYQASRAGVKIDLIIRGICCLRPGVKGISENIRVISIVGRFLEHARVYYFGNEGDPKLYIGSADPMPRNIDRRVEIVFPIVDPRIRQMIVEDILQVQLRDTEQARVLEPGGRYVPAFPADDEDPFNSQIWFLRNRQ